MRRRFAIALFLAILPFAVLTAGQAVWRLVRTHDEAAGSLIDGARASTVPEANLLAAAEGVLRGLMDNPAIRAGGAACQRVLAAALIESPYLNIARLDARGIVICSAKPVPANIRNRSGQPWWDDVARARSFTVSEQHFGEVSKQNVLTAAFPLFAPDGSFQGALALGIGTHVLADLMRARSMPAGSVAVLLDAQGTVISSTDEAISRALFAHPVDLNATHLTRGKDASGDGWMFALAEVRDNDLYIAFAQRERALFAWSYIDLGANVALPLLMALFAFGAIWYSADRFVLRWIAYLQRVARSYAHGHYTVRPEKGAGDAPAEIQQLAATMGEMAENIQQRDQGLRQALEQRKLMIREIHHRVKNNLQIVASLLDLEARRVKEPSARAALTMTHTRINAIALANRVLEEVDAQTVVNLRTMLRELAMLLHDAFGRGRDIQDIAVDAPDILLETDIAVPLALWLVEQLADIYRGAIEGQARIDLRLFAESAGEDVAVTILAEGLGEPAAKAASSFAAAYVRQLGAEARIEADSRRSVISLRFPRTKN